MAEISSNQDFIRGFAPGGRADPLHISPRRREVAPELQKYMHVLGPTPKRCLETLADLGLSDFEIGRYFRMPSHRVTEFRTLWHIEGCD